MIWILGGTSEGVKMVNYLEEQGIRDYLVTVATEDGPDFLLTSRVRVLRLGFEDMVKFIEENRIDLILDLSHPYALLVSKNARLASLRKGVKYLRYNRKETEDYGQSILLNSYLEAYEYLSKVKGDVLFTTGVKNIKDFEKVKNNNRFIYRILPSKESIIEARSNKVDMKDLICCLGPFSKDFNRATLKEYKVDYCVMKDSGLAGGTREKIQACEEEGVIPIVIMREESFGISNWEGLISRFKEEYNGKFL